MNAGQLILQGAGLIMGLTLIGFAVHAIRTGQFAGPKKIIYGTPTGIEYINRQSRPIAFWFCVIAYLIFGVGVLFCVLWVI